MPKTHTYSIINMEAKVTEQYPYFLSNRAHRHSLKLFPTRSEPRNILKIFLNFNDFEPHYYYKIHSYKENSVEENACTRTLSRRSRWPCFWVLHIVGL